MRVPDAYFIKQKAKLIVCFILGMLVGAFIIFFMHVHHMNDIVVGYRKLAIDYMTLESDYQDLKKSIDEMDKRSRAKPTIQYIEIDILPSSAEIDELTQSEIKKRLRNDLGIMLRQEVESVASTSEFVRQIVNNKRYIIQDITYQVKLDTLIIHTTSIFKVEISKVDS